MTVTDALSDEVTASRPEPVESNAGLPRGPGAGLHGCQGQCNNGIWYYEYEAAEPGSAVFTFSNPPIYGLP